MDAAVTSAASAAPAIETPPAHRQPGYAYHFDAADGDAIAQCLDEHGFAVARGVASRELVREMAAEMWRVVDPARTLDPGTSRYVVDYIERAPMAWKLLEPDAPFMRLCRRLLRTDQVVLHRTASIIRMPGAIGMHWHTDVPLVVHDPPRGVDEVLNCVAATTGGWLYLGGCVPEHGGLAVIEGSHREGWQGPEGWRVVPEHNSLAPEPGTIVPADGTLPTVPGMVAMTAEPGDLVLFAERTWHGVLPHRGPAARLGIGLGLRARDLPFRAPWPLPLSARQFRAALPAALQPLADGYPGIVDVMPG